MLGVSNYLAEWFGFRVWPPEKVDASPAAKRFQAGGLCPFISVATGEEQVCVKVDRRTGVRTGVCTISSNSNGLRQDWLACPFRVLDPKFTLLDKAIRHLFEVPTERPILLGAVTTLRRPDMRMRVLEAFAAGTPVFVFSQLPPFLGGEVKVPETPASPMVEIDSSIAELRPDGRGGLRVGRFIFFEVQTMDFHGSPLHAVNHLRAAREAGMAQFHDAIRAHPEWPGFRVEGPNKANVFKRTIYQTVYEIQLTRHPECAGFVIALPEPVWDSWSRHLGQPTLGESGGVWRLRAPQAEQGENVEPDRAWIYVFDIDRDSPESPQPFVVTKPIATTSAALIHYMFEASPQSAIERGAIEGYKARLASRVYDAWPGAVEVKRSGRGTPPMRREGGSRGR